MSSLPPVIIIDNGSGYLKAGFSNEETPSVTIPTLIGRQVLRQGEKLGMKKEDKLGEMKELMVGDEVIPFRSLLQLSSPVIEGRIQNEKDLETIWTYLLTKKLGIKDLSDLSDRRMIITEAPLNSIENKKIICKILFEQLGVGMINIEPQAKLSLFCQGIDTGMVLDSGDGVTHCIPIFKGHLLLHAMERLNIAGRHITENLTRLLQKKGYALNSTSDFETVREIKEKFCFVSCDIKGDREMHKRTTFFNSYYKLPDGSRIHLSNEKFEAPEILFNPKEDVEGIHCMVFKSINRCELDTRSALYSSIILSGGSTLFPGFTTRFEDEMKTLYNYHVKKISEDKPMKVRINVIDNYRRKDAVFLGAAIVGKYYNSPDADESYWITRDEWLEGNQEEIIKNKCQSYWKENTIKKK